MPIFCKSSFTGERASKSAFFIQKPLFGQTNLQLSPNHIKIRANEEFVEEEVLPKLLADSDGFVTLDLQSFPSYVTDTALYSQIHPGGFGRDLYYLTYKTLRKIDKQLAKRLFVQLQIDRTFYVQKDSLRHRYSDATWMRQNILKLTEMKIDTIYRKPYWALFGEPLPLPLNLPVRQKDQPFLITIGLVPEAVKPLAPK